MLVYLVSGIVNYHMLNIDKTVVCLHSRRLPLVIHSETASSMGMLKIYRLTISKILPGEERSSQEHGMLADDHRYQR